MMLTAALEDKHGKGGCFDVSVPLDPAVQQQVINKATAAVKRKQAEVAGLQEVAHSRFLWCDRGYEARCIRNATVCQHRECVVE